MRIDPDHLGAHILSGHICLNTVDMVASNNAAPCVMVSCSAAYDEQDNRRTGYIELRRIQREKEYKWQ